MVGLTSPKQQQRMQSLYQVEVAIKSFIKGETQDKIILKDYFDVLVERLKSTSLPLKISSNGYHETNFILKLLEGLCLISQECKNRVSNNKEMSV